MEQEKEALVLTTRSSESQGQVSVSVSVSHYMMVSFFFLKQALVWSRTPYVDQACFELTELCLPSA